MQRAEGGDDLAPRGHRQLQLVLELAAKALLALLGRIGDGDDHAPLMAAHRQGTELPRRRVREALGDLGIDRQPGELQVRQALLAGDEPREVALGDQPPLEQDVAEPLAPARRLLQCLLELLRGEQAGPEDERAERHVPHPRLGRLERVTEPRPASGSPLWKLSYRHNLLLPSK